MALLQWRRFNFFEKEILNLKDPEINEVLKSLKDVDITTCTSGRGQIIIGDGNGNLHFLDRNFQMTSFRAYEICVTHLYQLKQHNILVSVGEDEVGINPLIRVWNLDKTDKLGNPVCCQMLRAIPGNKPVPVSCLAVLENLTQIAVGFADGSVMIRKGDITRDRHSKQRIIHQDKHPVTGLAYKQSGSSTVLFVVTTETTLSYNTTSKDHRELLDVHGCGLRCSVISDATQENQFIVARSEALYFYQADGRGPCLAFEGDKQLITWYRGYLVVVSRDNKQIQRPTLESNQTRERNIVTVYDIQNKVIAFTGTFPGVVDVLSEWGSLYVLSKDNALCQLEEKDTQTKLEILFKKNLYAMAISLAKSQQYSDGLVDIFTQYGDHLYSKGDHDGAIKQYIKTIGHLEPSYVIRKFLDAQRIHNLTAYLQALHEQGLANADHTTLLLNCYTKLKDVSRLDEFIMTDKDLNFDIETAIKVCRQAGYYKHAVYLAGKFEQHDWYLKIQLEDLQDYEKALEYISKLDFYEAENNMKKYGKSLVNAVPEKATELLKDLCTDYRPKRAYSDEIAADSQRKISKARPEEFIHIFVHKKGKLIQFLEHMIHVQRNAANVLYNTLLELYLSDAAREKDMKAQVEHERKALDLLTNLEAQYDIDHAMVLAQIHRFKAGILYLYEKAKLYQQILHYHMEHDEYTNVIDTCKKYGDQDPSLWVQALSYFARKETDCKAQIMEVLSHIDKGDLMSPLLVLQTLAHNSTATLAVVKDYVIHRLEMEDEVIAQDERLIRQYKEETEKMRKEIKELKTSAKIFQGAKCSMCTRPLDLPAVHFLCQHSFHQLCFEGYAENENECPICAPENRKVLDIIRSQEQMKDLHEQFHRQLDHSSDGFSVVADYFGRGVFNKVTLLTDRPDSAKRTTHAQSATHEQKRERLLQAPISSNPFDEPMATNPFVEPGASSNPFYEPSDSKNPFY